jgi:hypothetical protein
MPPKQIARALGLRPSEVVPLLRDLAREREGSGPEPALTGCWVSAGWSAGLVWEGREDWREDNVADDGIPALATVVVARQARNGRVRACCYLVDPHCLGVKDTIGPRQLDRMELAGFRERAFGAYDDPPRQASLELAQHLVLGALEYARSLGFEPPPHFEACRDHLGSWTGPSDIRFGRDGKPFFMQGPRDDATRILRTLERTVGRGNFDFLTMMG